MHMKLTAGVALSAVLLSFSGAIAFRGDLDEITSGHVEAPADTADVETHDLDPTRIDSPIDEVLLHPKKLPPLPPENIDLETLWLARCIFSESKRPEEQELVAWVVRNRVETRYRGKRTYQDVILDPYQFSAFKPDYHQWEFYTGLHPHSKVPGWQRALRIAHYVRNVDGSLRPFSPQTRHFYSERSLGNGIHPAWATGLEPVTPNRDYQIEARRFRFFENVT